MIETSRAVDSICSNGASFGAHAATGYASSISRLAPYLLFVNINKTVSSFGVVLEGHEMVEGLQVAVGTREVEGSLVLDVLQPSNQLNSFIASIVHSGSGMHLMVLARSKSG